MILSIVLMCVLALIVLLNLGSFLEGIVGVEAAGSRFAGPRLEEMIMEDNGSANKIAVVRIEGIISGDPLGRGGITMVDIIKAELARASNDKRVKAVILKVDSPGGEVLASDDIARALADFQELSEKPIIVSMGSLAASGGYYVSAPCQWIVANKLTITGSIGVIMEAWNYRALMTKVGLKPFVFKSGENKDMLSGTRDIIEIPAEEREIIQSFVSQAYSQFTNVIVEGRSWAAEMNGDDAKPLAGNWTQFADGRILSGEEAYELGFVDQVGNFDDAVETALSIANIESANLVEYRQRHDFGDLLSLFGESEAQSVKLDIGVRLPPQLQAGRCYFIWSSFLP